MLAALYGSGYLQPRALAAMVRSSDFFWVCVGLGFLAAGALAEASPSGWAARPPTLEEALELVGAIPLLCYALSIAGRGAGPTPLVEQRA